MDDIQIIRRQDDHHDILLHFVGRVPAGLEFTLEVKFANGIPAFVKVYMGVPPSAEIAFSASVWDTLIEEGCARTIVEPLIEDLQVLMRKEALNMPSPDPQDLRN